MSVERQTRKLLTMNAALHPKSIVGRLHIPKEDGEEEFLSIEASVQQVVQDQEDWDVATLSREIIIKFW